MSNSPLGSSYLRFFASGGAVDKKWGAVEAPALISPSGMAGATSANPIATNTPSRPNPDNVKTDIETFFPDLDNPIEPELDRPVAPERGNSPNAYDQMLEADLRLRLENATPLERHLYEGTGMEPGLDRATVLPWSGRGADFQFSMPSLVYDLAKTAATPGAVVRGVPVSDYETVELGMNMMGSGMVISPSVDGAVAGMAVKNKGGNWLTGSLNDFLEGHITKPSDFYQEVSKQVAKEKSDAINNWLEKKAIPYIKNDMGTVEDPVRALIDSGVSHFDQGRYVDEYTSESARWLRKMAGFPEEGVATTPAGKMWEDYADRTIESKFARDFQSPFPRSSSVVNFKQSAADNPWIANLDPNTPIHYVHETGSYGTGIPDILRSLVDGMDPGSGLPMALRLAPKDLDKMSMPQAVEYVHKVNSWKTRKTTRDLNLAKDFAETSTYRSYDTVPNTDAPNESDLRWVELKLRGDTQGDIDDLNAALEYEGRAMAHSVADYRTEDAGGKGWSYGLGGWDALKAGHLRIYSLRDAKGHPHATIEVMSRNHPNARNHPKARSRAHTTMFENQDHIHQIKGHANGKPPEEYQPFIDDFILSEDWGSVGDLKNTNLVARDMLPYEQRRDPRLPPDKQWFTQQELYDLFDADKDIDINPEGFSRGGEVSKTAKWGAVETSALISPSGMAGATAANPIAINPMQKPNLDNVQTDIETFYPDLDNPVELEEDLFEAPSALSSYLQGFVALPETIGNYFLKEGKESGDIDFIGGSQLLEDAATMGGAMWEGIKSEPVEFLKDMTPGLGQYRAYNRAEELREDADLLEMRGDLEGAKDLRQLAFLEMTDATTVWPMAAGVGTRAARKGLSKLALEDSMSKLQKTIENKPSPETQAPNAFQFQPEGHRYDVNEPEADRLDRVRRDRKEFENQQKQADRPKPNKANWGVLAYHNTSPEKYEKIAEQDYLDPDSGRFARNNGGVWASKSNNNSSTYGAVSMPLRIDTKGFGYVDFMGKHWNDKDIPGKLRVLVLPEPMTEAQVRGFIGANAVINSSDILNSKTLDVSQWNTNEIGRIAREMGLPGLIFDNIADRGGYRYLPKERNDALELEMNNGGTTNYMVIDDSRIRSEITGKFDEANRGVAGLSKAEGGEVSRTAWEEINGY